VAVTASPGAGRVLVALADGPLVAEPTWTRYDNLTDCNCYGFDCNTGRQSELDTTDTGTATVFFHDEVGTLNDDALVGLQIMLQLYNPVTASWHIRWRGHIDDIDHALVDVPGIPLANVAVSCVGIFDYLGGVKFQTSFGDVAPAGMDGVAFYEDEAVDDRVIALLTDAGIDSAMRITFSGNVDVNETLYDAGEDVILQGVRDAADAEFPGVANFYEDRFGRAVFHGRFARFDPEGTEATAPSSWDFNRWNAATREDVTTGVAQVKEFSFNRPRARIINTYLAWPRADELGVEFDRALIPTLERTDPTSITQYGYRNAAGDAPDLIIKEHKTNGNTGADECGLFGDFYVTNYAVVRKAVQRCVFKSISTADARAAATWDLMTRCDVSDVIELTIDEAELADEAFFVDGISVECRVLNPAFDLVTVTPNLTPASYYGTDVFNP
jgi:hypothetical protein